MMEDKCFRFMDEIHNEIIYKPDIAKLMDGVDLSKQLHNALNDMKPIGDQEAIIFIGGDKSGKSTLINYILGNALTVTEPTNRQVINIVKDNKSTGPEISMQAYQEVRGPTAWTSSKIPGEKMLVEFPGHGKFSSVHQERFNNLLAPSLYSNVKQAKIVLVWNVMDILTGRFREYAEQFNFLENLFDSFMTALIPGIFIVFTHVPEVYGQHQVNIDYITRCISQYTMTATQLSPLARKFLHEVNYMPSRHAIFQKPTSQGPLTNCLDVNIQKSLLMRDFIVSDELTYFLFGAVPHSTSIFSQELADTVGKVSFLRISKAIVQMIQGISPADNINMKTAEELNAKKQRLMNYRCCVRQAMQPHTPIREKIEVLEGLDPTLGKIVIECKLYRKLELAKEVKNSIRLTLRRLSVTDKAMDYLLTKVHDESKLMIQNIDLQLRILKETETVCQLKKKNEMLEKKTIKLMEKIHCMKLYELRRKSLISRLFKRDRLATKILDTFKFCTQPVLRKLLGISGMQYLARRVRSGVHVLSDIIDGERFINNNFEEN